MNCMGTFPPVQAVNPSSAHHRHRNGDQLKVLSCWISEVSLHLDTQCQTDDECCEWAPFTFWKALWQEGGQAQISNLDFPAVPIDVDLHK